MGESQCHGGRRLDFCHYPFHLRYFWHRLSSELTNRPTVAVGEHVFVNVASNMVQHHRLRVAKWLMGWVKNGNQSWALISPSMTRLRRRKRRRLVGVDGDKGWGEETVLSLIYRGGRFLCRVFACANHGGAVEFLKWRGGVEGEKGRDL
ncbi:hypothetical protein GOBAR_DD31542 [Gossypium barbadense]|nr:hypothetical protein GOBAR_DD31542 [Gossypium barbadense]